jgi:glycogen(starch) synthase
VVIHRVMVPSGTFPHFYAEAAQANLSLQKAGEEIVDAEGPFDLVHTHDWLTASAAIGLKHRFKLPLLATIHATERGRGRGVLQGEQAQRINDAEWWLTYEAWRVVCCAQFMADEVHGYFGTPTDKIDVIPNGVDASPFQALDSASLQEFRLRYALPWEKIIMHVGRIVYEKGVDVLIRSVPQILAEAPEAKFVIAGRGPELDHLRQRVREMNLEQKVLLTGFISDEDRNKLYKVADVAVFPSLYEPFGIVALEAMAARTPVVVSAVGGLVEVVRHAETGITIHPGDPASCAWGILHTLQNPEWTTARVENAYREALTTFNWDTIAEQTNVVYTRVLEERARVNW